MNPTTAPAARTLPVALTHLIHLGLLAKHAHWNVAGPAFGSLHPLLDELARSVADATDRVAERLRALGSFADGRPSVLDASSLEALPDGELRDADVVAAMTDAIDAVATCVERAVRELDDDAVSQDVLVGIAGDLRKRSWLLRAHR